MKKLNVAVLGSGAFGNIHVEGYLNNPNCKVVAIACRTENHAMESANKYKIPKSYFGSKGWQDLLDKEDLDIVSICSPNYLHAPMILESIEKNVHILCEKPICISFSELTNIEEKLTKNKIFFTSFQKRYNSLFPLIKQIIDNKVLGEITLAKYHFSHYGPYKSWSAISDEKWFFDSEKAGGGVLLDLGVHCIDILRYLLGDYKKVEGINYNTSCIAMEEEDNCNVIFRFKNDSLAIISVSWCNQPSEILELIGTKGNLRINLMRNKITIRPITIKNQQDIRQLVQNRSSSKNTQHLLIDHFINCILQKKQESPNFEDGKRAVEFVLDAYSLK